jgi:transposase-like protein
MANRTKYKERQEAMHYVIHLGTTMAEAAEIVGVSANTLSDWSKEHKLSHGRDWLELQRASQLNDRTMLSNLMISLDNLATYHNSLEKAEQYKNAAAYSKALKDIHEQIRALQSRLDDRYRHATALEEWQKWAVQNHKLTKEQSKLFGELQIEYLREAKLDGIKDYKDV